mgnify:CR=1 FL=1
MKIALFFEALLFFTVTALSPKPLIIFVHGSGLTHMTWVLQTRYFAFHGYNALAIDLPGHGLSSGESLKSIEEMADWVKDVIDAVGH